LVDNLKSSFYLQLGQSAVIDAVYLSVEATAAHEALSTQARRAVVLISDGEDRTSFYTVDALAKLLRAKHVQVFVIGIVAKLDKDGGFIRLSPREAAEKLLRRIAEESGGRAFFPNNLTELVAATNEIAHDLHTQFGITYQRSDTVHRKGFQKVQVKIMDTSEHKKLTAITCPGYWPNAQDVTARAKEKK
jgi:Ca-activated chloride channel family protein